MSSRTITKRYHDPLDLVWIECAQQLGMEIVRDDEVFASWDGEGTLRVGLDSLDEDDCLAQMIFHEMCHAIVEGPQAFSEADWGLNGPIVKTRVHEFATLRLQARLADRVGLRKFFSATTDFHEYYQRLPQEPLGTPIKTLEAFSLLKPVSRDEDQQAIDLALRAFGDWNDSQWESPMTTALDSTRRILDIVSKCAPADSLWNLDPPD